MFFDPHPLLLRGWTSTPLIKGVWVDREGKEGQGSLKRCLGFPSSKKSHRSVSAFSPSQRFREAQILIASWKSSARPKAFLQVTNMVKNWTPQSPTNIKKILTSQNARNPEKFKVTRKWLKSDFWGPPQSNPQSNPKSNFFTRKVTQKWLFRVKKSLLALLLGLLWGGTPKVTF